MKVADVRQMAHLAEKQKPLSKRNSWDIPLSVLAM